MQNLRFITLFLLFQSQLFGQKIILIKDSLVDHYMKSGFATKHFRPDGKFNDNNQRHGKWKDYEVIEEGSYQMQDGMPMKTTSQYLLYGEGEFLDGLRTGPWNIYVIENSSLKKILSKKVTYVDGKEHGSFKYFYPNGSIAQTGNYKYGSIEDSVFIYYMGQELFGRQFFRDNKKEGEQRYYYPSGKLQHVFIYRDGLREGLHESYYENGNKRETFTYKTDKIDGIYKYYYENGNLWTEKLYSDNLLMNVIKLFNKDGRNLDHGTLLNGNGYVNYYTDEGKIYSRVTYKNGVEVKDEEIKN